MFYKRKNIKNNVDEIYFNSIESIKNTKEYMKTLMEIDCIKYALSRHTSAPNDLIDYLIDVVEDKVSLEYEFANANIFKFLINNMK